MENDKEFRELLRRAMPPVESGELQRELWPALLRRLDERPRRVPWFDWALVALVAIWALLSPQLLPFLLYQL